MLFPAPQYLPRARGRAVWIPRVERCGRLSVPADRVGVPPDGFGHLQPRHDRQRKREEIKRGLEVDD